MICCVVAVQNKINALVVFIASTSAASVSLLLVRVVARLPPKTDNGSGVGVQTWNPVSRFTYVTHFFLVLALSQLMLEL